jgi:hypothetical protein
MGLHDAIAREAPLDALYIIRSVAPARDEIAGPLGPLLRRQALLRYCGMSTCC